MTRSPPELQENQNQGQKKYETQEFPTHPPTKETQYSNQIDKQVEDGSNSELSSEELLSWLNQTLQTDYGDLDELMDGSAYSLLIDLIFPGSILLPMVNFRADHENDYIENFKLIQVALHKVGCDKEILTKKLISSNRQVTLEFLNWLKKLFDEVYDGRKYDPLEMRGSIPLGRSRKGRATKTTNSSPVSENQSKQLAIIDQARTSRNDSGTGINEDDDKYEFNLTLVNHPWSRRVLTLVGNKAKLMDSFSWLSTVGGGFSSLGERDSKFSMRAGALSLNQQLQIAELLGDARLKVMCHLFAAVAALQLDNKHFCINYIRRVILPLIHELPYRDPVLTNMLRHVCFRVSMLDRFVSYRNAAIEARNSKEN